MSGGDVKGHPSVLQQAERALSAPASFVGGVFCGTGNGSKLYRVKVIFV